MLNIEHELRNSTYDSISKTLQNIELQDLKFESKYIDYFLDVADEYMFQVKTTNTKKVGILGLNIPEEIILACGAKPVWILGGSFNCANYADSLLARDTDPMVKALTGMLLSKSFPPFMDLDLLIIPLFSDSMRKVASILSEHFNTFLLDIPPVKERESSCIKWRKQLERMTEKICSLTGKKLKKANLMLASQNVNNAKMQLHNLITNHKKNENLLSTNLYMLILNSYFMVDDLQEWTLQLECLNREIKKISSHQQKELSLKEYKPNVLLMGSSIFFPNMKIPTLFDDIGLNLAHFEGDILSYISTIPHIQKNDSTQSIFANISDIYYKNNTSQAFTNSKTKITALKQALLATNVDGVVYHVIRGQVSCDFEFESIENFFIEQDISILRLETDYNYQDIEQLRIRLEAFGEMIRARYTYNHKMTQEKII